MGRPAGEVGTILGFKEEKLVQVVGLMVSAKVGRLLLGLAVGDALGVAVGDALGVAVGVAAGNALGVTLGVAVGRGEG